MIEGYLREKPSVTGGLTLEPVVTLTVRGFAGQEITVEAVVDTGFDGYLSLRPEDIDILKIPPLTDVESILADGSVRKVTLYTAVIEWDGIERLTPTAGGSAEPLIGMELLAGYNLSVDAVSGGAVRITRLP